MIQRLCFFDIETVADESKLGLMSLFARHEEEAGRKFEPALYPEYCKIAAIGMAFDNKPVQAMVLTETYTEDVMLETFWNLIRGCTLVGFNVLSFDLPVIFVRSAELGVKPTRYIDRKPWSGQVIDLYETRRYTNGSTGLKWLADAYGFDRHQGSGAVVKDMDREEIIAYVKSDVEITRKLYHRYKGFFVPSGEGEAFRA